jgi:hypothetical protein
MQHPRQQAFMFLLGALLVGGALGFSARHVIGGESQDENWARRQAMYDDLRLSAGQRTTMDSLLDARTCQIRSALKPVRPQIDSIKAAGREQMRRVLTTEQWDRFETRAREDSVRHAQTRRQPEGCAG